MTLALRLGAFGGFAAPSGNRDLAATGFWNVMSGPQAATYNGKTYLAWCDSSRLIWAAEYVHATRALSTPVQLGSALTADDGAIHLAPAVLVRPSDHKIVVGVTPNAAGVRPVVWISTNAEDATSFDSANIFGTSGTYTYCDLVAIGSDIYFITGFWNGGERDMSWYVSSDGGATWGAKVTVMHPAVDSTFFWHVVGNDSRIDMYTTDTDRSSAPSKVYHAYWDGSTLRNSAGTSLGALAAFSNDGTLVADASLGGVYVESATTDGGNPAAVFFADTGTSTLQRRAVWNGSSWSLVTIADQGGYIGSNPNVAGGAIAWQDKTTAYLPVKIGSRFEMHRYRTSDGGTTWVPSALSSLSSGDNGSPTVPQDADEHLAVIWGLGSYTNDSTFSFDIHGWGT